MPRRCQGRDRYVANPHDTAVLQLKIHARCTGCARARDGPGPLAKQVRGSDVIGMNVGLEHVRQTQPELDNQRQVALALLANRIDQPSAPLTRDEIGVGG